MAGAVASSLPDLPHSLIHRILALLPREERWRARLVCRGLRTAVHGMQDLAFWLALTAGPLSGAGAASPWAGGSSRSSIGSMVASVPANPTAATARGHDAGQGTGYMSGADRAFEEAQDRMLDDFRAFAKGATRDGGGPPHVSSLKVWIRNSGPGSRYPLLAGVSLPHLRRLDVSLVFGNRTGVVPTDLPAACRGLGQLLDGCPALESLQLNIKQDPARGHCDAVYLNRLGWATLFPRGLPRRLRKLSVCGCILVLGSSAPEQAPIDDAVVGGLQELTLVGSIAYVDSLALFKHLPAQLTLISISTEFVLRYDPSSEAVLEARRMCEATKLQLQCPSMQKFRAMPLRDTETTTIAERMLQQAQIRRMLEDHLV